MRWFRPISKAHGCLGLAAVTVDGLDVVAAAGVEGVTLEPVRPIVAPPLPQSPHWQARGLLAALAARLTPDPLPERTAVCQRYKWVASSFSKVSLVSLCRHCHGTAGNPSPESWACLSTMTARQDCVGRASKRYLDGRRDGATLAH